MTGPEQFDAAMEKAKLEYDQRTGNRSKPYMREDCPPTEEPRSESDFALHDFDLEDLRVRLKTEDLLAPKVHLAVGGGGTFKVGKEDPESFSAILKAIKEHDLELVIRRRTEEQEEEQPQARGIL
jgi:hypothetical protein